MRYGREKPSLFIVIFILVVVKDYLIIVIMKNMFINNHC